MTAEQARAKWEGRAHITIETPSRAPAFCVKSAYAFLLGASADHTNLRRAIQYLADNAGKVADVLPAQEARDVLALVERCIRSGICRPADTLCDTCPAGEPWDGQERRAAQ